MKKIFVLIPVLICVFLILVVVVRVAKDSSAQKNTVVTVTNNESFKEEESKPTATPTPSPTPTPTPEPTEVPFSVLAPTTLMSFEELVGDNGDYTLYQDIPTPPNNDTYKLVINIFYQYITVFTKDSDGEFTIPTRYMICTTGKTSTPTPIGEFRTGEVHYRFNEFIGLGYFAQYWSQLFDDYYLHSILYTEKNAYRYTGSYKNLGNNVSHGCIRMLVPDARWVWYNVAPGTLVEVIAGEENPEDAKIREQLVFPPLPEKRPQILRIAGNIPITETWPKN
jgi:lipoprotein-anchoring transpeptidase ErfK/SrfK